VSAVHGSQISGQAALPDTCTLTFEPNLLLTPETRNLKILPVDPFTARFEAGRFLPDSMLDSNTFEYEQKPDDASHGPSWNKNMPQSDPIDCDVLVIGAGMAGMAAALFAANRGKSVVQVGIPGEIIYASGLLDVLGVYPIEKGRLWRNPWAAVAAVSNDVPNHPYAKTSADGIQKAFHEFLSFLTDAGLPYRRYKNRNVDVITPAGTTKRTYAVPGSMWPGVLAWQQKRKCLMVDFEGMKGFSTRQIRAVIGNRWPQLRAATVPFPEPTVSQYPEKMAFSLQQPHHREKLAADIAPLVGDARGVGFPAIFGIHRISEVVEDLRNRLGVPIFEVPTLPPAVTGLRLNDAFARSLPSLGVRTLYHKKVLKAQVNRAGRFACDIGSEYPELIVHAKAAILATGRFIGQGLVADRRRIRETLFDLPVTQPKDRTQWHRTDFLDHRGHAINQTGIETDNSFRPLNPQGRPAYQQLFAAGSILAHADWIRMKCGSGLAIATAYAAVKSCLQNIH